MYIYIYTAWHVCLSPTLPHVRGNWMPNVRDSDTPQDARDQRYRNWDAYEQDESDVTPFKDLIQRDGVVCDNCFVLRYETETHEWWRGEFGWLDYERWHPIPGRSVEVPADGTASGTRLACKNCGHRRTKQRPVPKHLILEYAKNISQTLDFKEIEHDREVLLAVVEERNNSENQGKQDSAVFAPAVKRAILAADD